jgi:hypothetical protein
MFSTAYAKAEATITKAIKTIAVSRPLTAFLFRANLFAALIQLAIFFPYLFFYVYEPANRTRRVISPFSAVWIYTVVCNGESNREGELSPQLWHARETLYSFLIVWDVETES